MLQLWNPADSGQRIRGRVTSTDGTAIPNVEIHFRHADFSCSWAWTNLAEQMKLVFPERDIVENSPSHHVFNIVFDIKDIKQVPNFRNGIEFERTGITHENDGTVPKLRGLFDDDGNLMVLINWNTDLGDAWEWADHPDYPAHFTTYAVKLGMNIVIYAMTH